MPAVLALRALRGRRESREFRAMLGLRGVKARAGRQGRRVFRAIRGRPALPGLLAALVLPAPRGYRVIPARAVPPGRLAVSGRLARREFRAMLGLPAPWVLRAVRDRAGLAGPREASGPRGQPGLLALPPTLLLCHLRPRTVKKSTMPPTRLTVLSGICATGADLARRISGSLSVARHCGVKSLPLKPQPAQPILILQLLARALQLHLPAITCCGLP